MKYGFGCLANRGRVGYNTLTRSNFSLSRGTPEYPVKTIWDSPKNRIRRNNNDLVERKKILSMRLFSFEEIREKKP